MTIHALQETWAERFGLALTPLFDMEETDIVGSHNVLLDGGYGSFALTVSEERIWKQTEPADWSWSSNLPHHVTVTDKEVAVVRWDKPTPEVLTRSSVENQIEAFYDFLASDRVKSSQRVVDFMLTAFRRIRSLVADARIDDNLSVDVYLAFLAHAIDRSSKRPERSAFSWIERESGDLLKSLSRPGVENLLEDFLSRSVGRQPLALLPTLAVRHAGSEIFQEAHFELIRAPSPDLFGYVGPAEVRQITRGGAHFTPAALARSIAEQALSQIPNLHKRESLVILDPACGSGAFLHEALRTLRRLKFSGRLRISGRDISRPAITMAKFVLNSACSDWIPRGGCTIDIEEGDSLVSELPVADVVLMNPPFVAWSALSPAQRHQVQDVLGHRLGGRGDFSMAFITRAVESLSVGGVLGTLLPASLLTLQAADAWRRDLLDKADLVFIASIGDYGLFSYAMVQVAAAIFCKPRSELERKDNVLALLTANDPEATGNALRNLRRREYLHGDLGGDGAWSSFRTSAKTLKSRGTWRLTSPRAETALRRLVDGGNALPIGELFEVRQGVRTGMNPAFILTSSQVEELPSRERKWFRPAIMNDSINSGQVDDRRRVFYPYNREGLTISTEDQLRRFVPNYFNLYLQPRRRRLEQRSSILEANRSDWWGLSRHRVWALDPRPRLLAVLAVLQLILMLGSLLSKDLLGFRSGHQCKAIQSLTRRFKIYP